MQSHIVMPQDLIADLMGQSELIATNAPIRHYVHWMGYISSFGARWG